MFPWQEEVVRDIERWHWSSDHDICQSKEGESCVSPLRIVEMACKKNNNLRNWAEIGESESGALMHWLPPCLRLARVAFEGDKVDEMATRGRREALAHHSCTRVPYFPFSRLQCWLVFGHPFSFVLCFYLRSCDRTSGTFRPCSHYIPDRFCAGTKTIPDKASVHTRQQLFRSGFCNGAKLRHADLKMRRVTYRISFHTKADGFSLWHEKLSVIVWTQLEIGLRVGDWVGAFKPSSWAQDKHFS